MLVQEEKLQRKQEEPTDSLIRWFKLANRKRRKQQNSGTNVEDEATGCPILENMRKEQKDEAGSELRLSEEKSQESVYQLHMWAWEPCCWAAGSERERGHHKHTITRKVNGTKSKPAANT